MRIILLTLVLALIGTASAETMEGEAELVFKRKVRTVRHLSLNPTLIRAVRLQNAQRLTQAVIDKRDAEWKNSDEVTAFKRTLQESRAGQLLRQHIQTNEAFNEAFLTDNQGANVAAYPPTTDYFQGDEEKWTESFNDGEGRIYTGPIEVDDSTGVPAIQVSAPVLDKGKTIGVLVVGIKLEFLKEQGQFK